MRLRAVTICFGALPSGALAQGAEDPLGYEVLLRMSGGLLLVVALVFAAAWGLRRFGRLPATGNGTLQLLGGIAVGQRERVVLIKAGGETLLLGVAPGRVQMLHALRDARDGQDRGAEEAAELPGPIGETSPPAAQEGFQHKLRGLLKRGGMQ